MIERLAFELRYQIEDLNVLDFSGWRKSADTERQFAKPYSGVVLIYMEPPPAK